jgi:hypothetical protein
MWVKPQLVYYVKLKKGEEKKDKSNPDNSWRNKSHDAYN